MKFFGNVNKKSLPCIPMLIILMLSACVVNADVALGEIAPPNENTHEEVVIKVRAIEATQRSQTYNVDAETIAEGDARLTDISKNLAHLEFTKFKLISEQEVKVPMMSKEVLTLGAGQTLTVRPLYVSSGRVGMWIHWADKDATLLDTRMHFACTDKVITGAESDTEGATAMILAVAAHLVKE